MNPLFAWLFVLALGVSLALVVPLLAVPVRVHRSDATGGSAPRRRRGPRGRR